MADKSLKFPDNVPGKFYVDESCIVCGACEAAGPSVFKLADDGSHDVVYNQPKTPEELQEAMDAMDGCPVGAIGDDGE